MSGDESDRGERLRHASVRFDYASERRRHEKFVGRAELLAGLDRELIDSEADRWVVVTGGPGMGKSALLAAWLTRREAKGEVVPHHFIRRGLYDWDDPAQLVGSLVAQLDDGFPTQREPAGDNRMHPATRLSRALSRVANELRPRGTRLVVLIDGLDEYDPKAGPSTEDALAAFLPDALPAGVSILCASRPRHPYVSNLAARDGELVQIDLDDPDLAADNDATVCAFWEAVAGPLGLGADFIAKAVACARGNLQHAVQLRKHLSTLPLAQRCVEDIPRGLAALIEKSWARIAAEPAATGGLGILCVAREALTLDELGAVAGWSGDAQRRIFMYTARELLMQARRSNGEAEYRLHHDSIASHITLAIGSQVLRAHHLAFAHTLAAWPARIGTSARRYALRHALTHRAEAGEWASSWQLATDMSFLEAKCRELGVHETEADLVRIAERARASDDTVVARRFRDLARAVGRDSHWLRDAPEATAAVVWNRLRRLGWPADELDDQLRVPVNARFLRLQRVITRETPALVRDLVGHEAGVDVCAVTSDGRRVISASEKGTLKVWDLPSGRALATLEGQSNEMGARAVMPDVQRTLEEVFETTMGIYKPKPSTHVSLPARHDRVTACVVTPDSRCVVSVSENGTLKVWDLESGRVFVTLEGHARSVLACAVTSDGRRVVSISRDGTLRVWDLESGRLLTTEEARFGELRACAVTPDGRRVVSISEDGTLRGWDLDRGHLCGTLKGRTAGWVQGCAATLDGRRMVLASYRTLEVWDLESLRLLAILEGHANAVTACAVTADGRRAVSASEDRTLKVWDLESGRMLSTLEGHAGEVRACAVTPDGRCVVSASADRTLKVWDLESGRLLTTKEGHLGWVRACAVTPDGRRAVSASEDRTLKVWDLESGRVLAVLEGHASGVMACAVTPDGRRVVSASCDRTLKVWDLENGCDPITLDDHTGMVTACRVTLDGRRMVSASYDGRLKVWDLESNRVVATLEAHASWLLACAVTPDGRRVVSASRDRTLKVWDIESGRKLAALHGHAAWVRACAVTPDGRRVVSASDDQTLKVWDLENGRVLATLEGHANAVLACAVTPDGRCVISGSNDRTLRVWDLDTFTCELVHHGDAPYGAVTASATRIVAGDSTGAIWFLDWPRAVSSPRPAMKKHTILFLAANPIGMDRVALDREARDIQVELERSAIRGRFEFVTRWAAEPLDLLRELRRLRPTVVHFAGHGAGASTVNGDAPSRDVADQIDPRGEQQAALFFQGPEGRPVPVSTAAIATTFGAVGSSVQLVVLNACYSDAHAEQLLAHVDCVVGMTASVHDDAARSFAIGFYGGLGERASIAAACEQGRAAMSLTGWRDSGLPNLRARKGLNADQLVLADATSSALGLTLNRLSGIE